MSYFQVEQSAVVAAPPQDIYTVFADYQGGHQAILPKAVFKEVVVNKGGVGEGTAVTVHMQVFGSRRVMNMVLIETEPGRVLTEFDEENDTTTMFTCAPVGAAGEDGQQTLVTISTQIPQPAGWRGRMEKWLTCSFFRRVYRQELENLRAYLARKQVVSPVEPVAG